MILRRFAFTGMVAGSPYRLKTFFSCIFIATFLVWMLYELFTTVKFASPSLRFAITQVLVVLLAAPYLSARAVVTVSSTQLLVLSPVSLWRFALIRLIYSQSAVILWSFLSTGFLASVFYVGSATCLKLLAVLVICSITGAAVGAGAGLLCRDALFGTELTYLLWSVLIGGVFLLGPLDRYVDNIQSVIPPFLNVNPVMAACNLFFEEDIFRTPLLYDLTPVSSYVITYPSWYRICFWQLGLGVLCVFGILFQSTKNLTYKKIRV